MTTWNATKYDYYPTAKVLRLWWITNILSPINIMLNTYIIQKHTMLQAHVLSPSSSTNIIHILHIFMIIVMMCIALFSSYRSFFLTCLDINNIYMFKLSTLLLQWKWLAPQGFCTIHWCRMNTHPYCISKGQQSAYLYMGDSHKVPQFWLWSSKI